MTRRRRGARPKNEFFDGVSRAFKRAWQAGDVHPEAFQIGIVLLCARNWMTDEWIGTLADLLELLGWPPSRRDTLVRRLNELRQAGWIDFENPGQGRRRPWKIRIGPIDFRNPVGPLAEVIHELPRGERAFAEVTSAAALEEGVANPRPAAEPVAFQLPQTSPPRRNKFSEENSTSLPSLSHGDSNGDDLDDDRVIRETETSTTLSKQLTEALQPLGLTATEIAAAHLDPARAIATARHVVADPGIRSPRAYWRTVWATGELPEGAAGPARGQRTIFENCSAWIVNAGHYGREALVLEELADRERKRDERLTDTQRAELLELWRSLQAGASAPQPAAGAPAFDSQTLPINFLLDSRGACTPVGPVTHDHDGTREHVPRAPTRARAKAEPL